ncbi:MAG TPA: hypothetical protein VFV93_12150 [Thermomicrobiales bacterium]|nr:hypothetical protein [Thermomicrobiales bacterium]
MTEPQPTRPPDDLEQALTDLGVQLDWPAEPDLLPAVRQNLASRPPRQRLFDRVMPLSTPRRVAWAAVTFVLIAALVLTISDSTRSTIADRLGLPGVSISTEPTATAAPGAALSIGEPVTLDEAIARVGSGLLLPPTEALGAPDGVYMLDQDSVVQVTYVYLPRPDLPEAGQSGVGLLISQFAGHTNQSFIQKQLGSGTTIEQVDVAGQPGFWLVGAPHVFFYERPDGQIREESIRLAANVLLWEQDGQTLRIETALNRDAAIRIATAMVASH